MGGRCLLVFTKPPIPGRVKTRLIGHLSAAAAAQLHQALLLDLLDALAGGRFSVRLLVGLEAGEPLPAAPAKVCAAVSRQRGADLGERLWNALADAARDADRIAVVGSDLPGLDAAGVEEAFAALERGGDVAIGPAADGGYCLLAVRGDRLDARLFTGIDWSTPRVLAQTLERCHQLGLRVVTLAERRDVDVPEDLAWLADGLRTGSLASPRVAKWLRRNQASSEERSPRSV